MPRTPALLLALLLISPASYAAKWSSIGNSKDSARIEIDFGSRHQAAEGKVRIWHRESYNKPKLPDSGAFSFSRLTTLSEFQCDKRQVATLQQRYSAADGTELKNETFDGKEFQPVIPDTSLEPVFHAACKPQAKPAAETPPPPPVVEKQDEPAKKKGGKKAQEEPPAPPPHWSYTGNTGPEKWGSLGKDFATCSLGQRQSPIDIRKTVKADLAPIHFDYQPVALSITDNGHSIKVDTPNAGGITVDGEKYALLQFHFHKPSEEKINGKQYDMVAHLVHQAKDGRLAVVGVLMEEGKEQPLIRTLWTHLPIEQGKAATPKDVKIDPTHLLPAKRSYFTFIGSLTTPPCTEGVLWLVLKTPVQVSKEQLSGFGSIYRNNVRPVQAVNSRVIKESR